MGEDMKDLVERLGQASIFDADRAVYLCSEAAAALTAAQARIATLETELKLTASTAGTFQSSAESALARLAAAERERDALRKTTGSCHGYDDDRCVFADALAAAERERDLFRRQLDEAEAQLKTAWRTVERERDEARAKHDDLSERLTYWIGRGTTAERERDEAHRAADWNMQVVADRDETIRTIERERDEARAALLQRIRDDNGCTPGYLVQAPECMGWDATQCGCAEEARNALSPSASAVLGGDAKGSDNDAIRGSGSVLVGGSGVLCTPEPLVTVLGGDQTKKVDVYHGYLKTRATPSPSEPMTPDERAQAGGTKGLVERLRAMVPYCEDPSDYTEDDRVILEAASALAAMAERADLIPREGRNEND